MNGTRNMVGAIKAVALVLSVLSVVACASLGKAPLKQTSSESAASFAAGDYAKAIEFHRSLYVKDRGDGKVVSAYLAMIEDVKSAGDEARGKGSYTTAQGAYGVLAEDWDGFSALAPRLSFTKTDLEAGLRDCLLGLCDRQFREEVGAGNHAKALAMYQTALKEYPGDKAVKAAYAKKVGEIKAIGDKAFAAKDYGLAGKINSLLLKNIESSGGVAGAAARGVSRQELAEAVRKCSSGLTNGGLQEYRNGNLESAITLWGDLLAFEPDNDEIRKAVETAKAQLNKLKSSAQKGSKRGGGRSTREAHQPGR